MACLTAVVPDVFAGEFRAEWFGCRNRETPRFPRLVVDFNGESDAEFDVLMPKAAGAVASASESILEDPERWDGLS